MPEFLVNSLGYSKEKATSASTMVTFLKPGNNKPDLVLNFFKQIGLDKTQIKLLISPAPRLLFADVSKTLEPKIKVLQEFGLSGSDLVRVISRSGTFLRTDRAMAPNISLLQNLGCSSLDIEKLVLRNPRIFLQKPEWLEDIVEKDFCIRRDSRMFFYGVESISSLSEWKSADFTCFRHYCQSCWRRTMEESEIGHTEASVDSAAHALPLPASLIPNATPELITQTSLVNSSAATSIGQVIVSDTRKTWFI
ncbi:hypothetical protein K7X08_025762 [Anisodus acutangulus]|uniref:Uncharacterized protein n=1 Tax=Anisodus acutangulus TaxID=402998 RepID=A0A9Q1L8Z5_9SOLA|nr:hypothetical protein K7X08_025762 [Anisodus acutangulus]